MAFNIKENTKPKNPASQSVTLFFTLLARITFTTQQTYRIQTFFFGFVFNYITNIKN